MQSPTRVKWMVVVGVCFLVASTSLLSCVSMSGLAVVAALTPSGPITITGQNGTVITGLQITSGSGDCVRIINSSNITIKASEIGPCVGGNAVYISGGTNNHIYDNYIHPERRPSSCCDTGDGVLVDSGTTSTTIQGNVICFGEANVVSRGANGVTVTGNYLCNPQGNTSNAFGGGRAQNIHGAAGSSNTTITNNFLYSCERAADGLGATTCPTSPNYVLSAHQEDSINFYGSTTALVQGNYVIGGSSTSGTAMIADGDSSGGNVSNGMQFLNNIVHNSAHVGISVVVGTSHIISGNKIQNACLGGWDCTNDNAISVFDNYGHGCGSVQVNNNIADQTRPSNNSVHAAYWGGPPSCTNTTLSGNTFDLAAYNILNPIEVTNPPPAIPPTPQSCVTVSPYTTNTSLAACDGGGTLAAPTSLRVIP